ncbi:MAG: MerR family transcriptional regulator [Acidobacteria bacterium]|nr:MerR family transcriptional regulator [Acidobacteriota bacterium]
MFKTKPRPAGPENGERTFSSADVARLADVSLRQLQWWDEQRVVSPRHQGHKRLYFTPEVVEVSVIAELRRKGFSLQKIRRTLRFLQREMGKRLADIMNVESEIHLLTDGKSIYLEADQGRIIDILKNAKQPMFLVCVTDQVRRLTVTPRKPPRSETSVVRKAKAV